MKCYLPLFLFLLHCGYSFAQSTSDYNIVWTTPSNNASESMPCGGGDIGMNVWVEKGDVLIYVARSGSFNEDNALMKAGRVRISLSPNPFKGKALRQELHLQEGYVTIFGEQNGVTATIKIWADVFSPVAHFEITSNKKIVAEASYESWRYQDRVIQPRENFGNSWKWAAPKNNVYKKDSISFYKNGVLFYHHNNAVTIFDKIVEQQGMLSVKKELYNPLVNLAYGGFFGGNNFTSAGTYEGNYVNTDYKGWKLKSIRPAKQQSIELYLHNAQVAQVSNWQRGLDSIKNASLVQAKSAYRRTQQWWKQFWNRSFVHIDPAAKESKAWEIGRNFQLFRYMQALNAKGSWPTKFNGGLLTVDPSFTDTAHKLTPDYRNWGGGLHTAQNQRLVYFPMIKNGDWDMLQPQLNFYMRLLENAETRSKLYWNHGGACFTEQMENFGLPNYAEYGQKRPEGYDKGMEYNAWLEYQWDTVLEFCLMMLQEQEYTGKGIKERLAFIVSCLRFFDEHYQYLAKQRGIKGLNAAGKLVLYPGSAAETYKMAYNATSTIAALQVVSNKMLELPVNTLSVEQKQWLTDFVKRIPELTYTSHAGHVTISPAENWERINNTESPQLYPVYPWGIFGIGRPGLDTAINTYRYDTSVVKFRHHIGWKQDNIWAARLGLANEAWDLTSKKLQNSERRFPAFWGPGFDWVPDHNWGGSGMIGLQEMLMQTVDDKIFILPAWPMDKDVHFKLHAPGNTTVEVELKNGTLHLLKVLPVQREKHVVLPGGIKSKS